MRPQAVTITLALLLALIPALPSGARRSRADSDQISTLVAMGDFHSRRGELEEAIAYYERGLELDPANSKLHKKLANAIKDCKREDALLHAGLRCGEGNPGAAASPTPNPSLAALNLGDFHMQRGEWDDAIASYAEGLRRDPSSAVLRQKLDNAVRVCKQEDALLHVGLKCGAEEPGSPPLPSPGPEILVRISMGDFHLGRGEYDDAIASYEEGLRRDPSSAVLRQKLDNAVRVCKQENALRHSGLKCGAGEPASPPLPSPNPEVEARISTGDFHLRRGEYDDAIASYQEALRLDPSNSAVRWELDRAIRACEVENRVLVKEPARCGSASPTTGPLPKPGPSPLPNPGAPLSPKHAEILESVALGDFHFKRGEYDEAIAYYQRGLRLDPSITELSYKLDRAIEACQKENAVLNPGRVCGARPPVVKLIPSGEYQRRNGPITKGQMVPDNNIEGGLKPVGSLSVPPLPKAPQRAVVIFVIAIDPDGNVSPGRTVSDDNGLAPEVMAAARGWKFEPPTVNGERVSTTTSVVVVF